jgi:hypothetical protein
MAPMDMTSPTSAPSPIPMKDGMKPAGAPMSATDMKSVTDLGDPMSQEGSGTSWVPRSTQMFGWMRIGPRDMQMTHGEILPR